VIVRDEGRQPIWSVLEPPVLISLRCEAQLAVRGSSRLDERQRSLFRHPGWSGASAAVGLEVVQDVADILEDERYGAALRGLAESLSVLEGDTWQHEVMLSVGGLRADESRAAA
jgi:hypothetical protein